MRPDAFRAPEFGRPTRDGTAFWYYEPEPIPRTLDLSMETVLELSEADDALGRLASAGRYLADPSVFIRPYITREALASSRIEGTLASLSDVFEAEAAGEPTSDANVMEVLNYVAAVDQGVELLERLPICTRLVKALHETLMRGVRGEEKRPGHLRETHVFIGAPGDPPDRAVFVPPLPRSLPGLLGDWERFANEPVALPVLVQCALLHYQFETIHPFLDGNGRLGRLMIVFFLMAKMRLPAPLLYVSAYLEEERREYYDRLQAVRERGEISEWLRFFLRAIKVQAEDAAERSQRLFDLREQYRSEMAGTRSRASEVVDLLFENPFVTSRAVQRRLGVTNQGALNLIERLERQGWLRSMGVLRAGRGRRGGLTYWLAPEVFRIINDRERLQRTAEPPVTTRIPT
jgi:Fic family protein